MWMSIRIQKLFSHYTRMVRKLILKYTRAISVIDTIVTVYMINFCYFEGTDSLRILLS